MSKHVGVLNGTAPRRRPDTLAVGDVLIVLDARSPAAVPVGSRLAAAGGGSVTGCTLPQRLRRGRWRDAEPTVLALLQRVPGRQRGRDAGGRHAGDLFMREALKAGAYAPQWAALDADDGAGFRQLCSWHDLIIVQRMAGADARPLQGLDELLRQAARPVLVLPASCSPTMSFDRVVIAYDGSSPATSALRSALPLAAAARHVHLLDGSAAKAGMLAFDPLRFLERHGVVVSPHRLAGHIHGAQLLSQVGGLQANLLVMGAYGHSPLRERLLGGITRHVLAARQLAMAVWVQH